MENNSYSQAAVNIQHEVMKMNPLFPPAARPEKIDVRNSKIKPLNDNCFIFP